MNSTTTSSPYAYYKAHEEQIQRIEALLGVSGKLGLEIASRARALLVSHPSEYLRELRATHSHQLSLSLNILACAEKSARAIRHLSAGGFGEAGMTLVRTISECLFQFMYLSGDPHARFLDWKDFTMVEELGFLMLRDKHPGSKAFGNLTVAISRAELDQWWQLNCHRYLSSTAVKRAARNDTPPRPASTWVKPSCYEIAASMDLQYEYDRDFVFASRYVHPGPRTHASYAYEDRDTGLPTADPQPSNRCIATALTFAESSFATFLYIVNASLGLDFEDDLANWTDQP